MSCLPNRVVYLAVKKNVKIHPDLGTPKRCLLSAMRIGCEYHLLYAVFRRGVLGVG